MVINEVMKVYSTLVRTESPVGTTYEVKVFADNDEANEWAENYIDEVSSQYTSPDITVTKKQDYYSIFTGPMLEDVEIIIEKHII